MSDNSVSNNASLGFEEAIARLDEIVSALEGGKAPLDESLSLFEEGIRLVKSCSEKIESAEQQVKLLMTDRNGDKNERDITDAE